MIKESIPDNPISIPAPGQFCTLKINAIIARHVSSAMVNKIKNGPISLLKNLESALTPKPEYKINRINTPSSSAGSAPAQ